MSSASAEAILATRALTKEFGTFRAVDGVDMAVRSGTIHAVIGPNGAGKSTFFKLMTGVLRPSSGQVLFGGADIGGERPHAIARRGLVQVFQLSSICHRLTVWESVAVGVVARRRTMFDLVGGARRATYAEALEVLEEVGLAHLADVTAGSLSHGDQRALEIAMAVATRPRVLLLDEPTAGMSPAETKTIANLIMTLSKSRHVTVVLSEHDMDVVFGISDHVTVLHEGKVIAEGVPSVIRDHPEVTAVYLGQRVAEMAEDGPR